MQYNLKNYPLNPNFALPGNSKIEPGRGTYTTKQLPRRTFGPVPEDWDGGFALPDYVRAEPQGRGSAIGTRWLDRGHIPLRVPQELSGDGPAGLPWWVLGIAAGAAYYWWRNR